AQFGDHVNFDRQQRMLRDSVDPQVVQQTFAHPYLYLWGCACLVGMGEFGKGADLLQQGNRLSQPFATPHMHSQLLQWQAYIHALQGNAEDARAHIREAGRLRAEAGGRFYEIFYNIIAGATHARLGDHDQARALLSSGIEKAEQMPSDYLLAAGLMHRAWLHLARQDMAGMEQDLARGLSLMRDNGFTFFWSWEPGFMGDLLARAMDSDLAPFADRLARERLDLFFDSSGAPCPLLSISMLGGFRIAHGSRTLLTADDFTPAQRHMLSLLMASNGLQISQEAIQAELWPDSPPDKARSKLDTLVMRLRRVLATAVPAPAKNYLVMQRGILSLKNCRTDGEEFSRLVHRGLALAREEKYWLADNAFHRALVLWKGAPDRDDLYSSRMDEYSDRLLALLARMGQTWAMALAESERTEEAIEVLDKVLSFNRMEDRLISLLYTLYLRTGNMLKARELLGQYRQTLRDQGYPEDEVDDLVFRIASSAA
ncbi:MAG TPA: hypothetical protein ENK27_10890, partial [Desulfobulbus sp.]|nr:hypothetical protein [Desulfobulbus sp.]